MSKFQPCHDDVWCITNKYISRSRDKMMTKIQDDDGLEAIKKKIHDLSKQGRGTYPLKIGEIDIDKISRLKIKESMQQC